MSGSTHPLIQHRIPADWNMMLCATIRCGALLLCLFHMTCVLFDGSWE